jgi:hypothetical protein
MIDYRYHALSLAAVLFALALGVLLGVAIGDSNLVSSAKSGVVHNLNAEVDGARRQASQLQEQLTEEQAFANGLYPLTVHSLLSGRSIGLVFLGGSSDQVNAIVRSSVAQAAGNVATVVAVREPLELASIGHEAAGTHYAALAGSVPLVERFGQVIGHELVSGGPQVSRELLSRVRAGLLSAFDGQLGRLEGLVVMRADPRGMSAPQAEASAAFESGMMSGVLAAGVPVVGVELSTSSPSQVPWYKSRGIASVDDLETLPGQAALVLALDGHTGAFGTKPTADALLPGVGGASGGP